MRELARARAFGGRQIQFAHAAAATRCEMRCSLYLPPRAEEEKVPVIYWLSGLTCSDENFVTKAGAQRYAAECGVAIVAPDTSPRGEGVPDDENGAWDFGLGAGFYVNATRAPWAEHYRMYDYVARELPAFIGANFPVDNARQSVCGHSMGGHGALTIALKNPRAYRSVSAFAPIASPMNCPWGEKALSGYLGGERAAWGDYDACALVRRAADADEKFELLVEQGDADNFLREQLKPELLRAACDESNYPLRLNMRAGYDHSYYFIASFIGEHIAFHAARLRAAQ